MGRICSIITLIFFLVKPSLGQFSWERPGLKGQVREIYAERVDIDSSTPRAEAKRLPWYHEDYNSAGFLVLITFFKPGKEEPNNTWAYAFDSAMRSAVATVYDDKRQLLWKEVYSLDNDEKPISAALFGPDGSSKTEYSYVYNHAGRLTEWLASHRDGSKYPKNRYRYDRLGRLIEETTFGPNGSFSSNNVFAYDSRGQISQVNGIDDSGKEHHWRYDYKYDSVGNWIERTKSARKTGESKVGVEEIVFRTIAYFEK